MMKDEVYLQQTLKCMCHVHLATYDGDAIHQNLLSWQGGESLHRGG